MTFGFLLIVFGGQNGGSRRLLIGFHGRRQGRHRYGFSVARVSPFLALLFSTPCPAPPWFFYFSSAFHFSVLPLPCASPVGSLLGLPIFALTTRCMYGGGRLSSWSLAMFVVGRLRFLPNGLGELLRKSGGDCRLCLSLCCRG